MRGIAAMLSPLLAAAALAVAAAPAGAATQWLCAPDVADDPCEIGLETTVRGPGGKETVERPERAPQSQRPVDCFYVYPTVSNQPTPNATLARDPEIVSIAEYQAAPFSTRCRIFAPLYRQGTVAGLATAGVQDTETVRRTAYADVRAAWREYLEKENRGRGVVLLGHSQGTRMLRQLLRAEIEPDPAARRRVVSALLLGGNVTVRRGRVDGGDFARFPLCEGPGQFGCVVAYSTFAQDPPDNSRYGRVDTAEGDPFGFPTGPEYDVACTDPSALAGIRGPLRLLVPTEPFAPGVIAAGTVITAGGPPPSAPTPWVVPPDRFAGGCAVRNGAHVLRHDPTPGSRRPNPFPEPGWGTHLIDVNLTLDRLLEIVRLQTERYRSPRIALTRRCLGGGRLRLRLTGDTGVAGTAVVRIGRRRVARLKAPAFERTLTRRVLERRGKARWLRAVVGLEAGEPERLVLRRSLPGCGIAAG